MGNIAAFYDIDGTLYREALSVELFKKLSKNGIVSDYKWYNEVKPLYDKWVNREANYDDYIDKLSKVYHECIVGVDEGVIKFLAKQVIEEKCEKFLDNFNPVLFFVVSIASFITAIVSFGIKSFSPIIITLTLFSISSLI